MNQRFLDLRTWSDRVLPFGYLSKERRAIQEIWYVLEKRILVEKILNIYT